MTGSALFSVRVDGRRTTLLWTRPTMFRTLLIAPMEEQDDEHTAADDDEGTRRGTLDAAQAEGAVQLRVGRTRPDHCGLSVSCRFHLGPDRYFDDFLSNVTLSHGKNEWAGVDFTIET